MDIASLAELLHETSEHHDPYEKSHAAHNWWDWYAAYMDARQHGSAPDEASAARPAAVLGLRAASGCGPPTPSARNANKSTLGVSPAASSCSGGSGPIFATLALRAPASAGFLGFRATGCWRTRTRLSAHSASVPG
jgi:hypothetical protein